MKRWRMRSCCRAGCAPGLTDASGVNGCSNGREGRFRPRLPVSTRVRGEARGRLRPVQSGCAVSRRASSSLLDADESCSRNSFRQCESWLGLMLCRAATACSEVPGSKLSATISRFRCFVQRRRRFASSAMFRSNIEFKGTVTMIPKIDRFCSVSRAANACNTDRETRAGQCEMHGNRRAFHSPYPVRLFFRTNQMHRHNRFIWTS